MISTLKAWQYGHGKTGEGNDIEIHEGVQLIDGRAIQGPTNDVPALLTSKVI